MDEHNPAKYCEPDGYLLTEVGPAFRKTGKLDSADFYTILDWKAQRAKNRHRDRLKRIAGGSFRVAVNKIAAGLHSADGGKDRLNLLMDRWEFLLPTGTTVLSFLYPDEFTIFDWRVCDELGFDYEPWCWRGFSEELWKHYEAFIQAVKKQTPPNLSLQQKDRFLIGLSLRKSIEADCER